MNDEKDDILEQDEDDTYRHMMDKKKVLDMEMKLDKALDLTLVSLAEGIKSQQIDSGFIVFSLYTDIAEQISNAIGFIKIDDADYKKKIDEIKKDVSEDDKLKNSKDCIKNAMVAKYKFGLVVAAVHEKTKNKKFTGKVGV